MTDGLRVGESRPGGRSARVRNAVLDAAVEVLAEVGYEAFSIEEVATRAGVHKTTVYRRWPTKADLVTDASRARSRALVPTPDTGTLLGDLQALARSVARNVSSDQGGRMARTMVAAGATSADAAAGTAEFFADRIALAHVIVERAIERGELPVGTDANLVIETLIGPLYVRLLLTGEPIDAAFADRIAAVVAAGASAASPATKRARGGRDVRPSARRRRT
jgi:AcrR family transcriptional regulator